MFFHTIFFFLLVLDGDAESGKIPSAEQIKVAPSSTVKFKVQI